MGYPSWGRFFDYFFNDFWCAVELQFIDILTAPLIPGQVRWRARRSAALCIYPPRQALCLRMAYRVPYPNLSAHIPFLPHILPYIPYDPYNVQEIPKGS